MDIYFLDLKYGNTLNCSYALETGSGQLDFDKSSYAVGDAVSLFVEVPGWQHLAIKENCIDELVDKSGCMSGSCYIIIEFIIKKKRHTLVHSAKNRAHLQPHSPNIYLEPISWGHEDIFKWLHMGILPSWITEEEIVDYRDDHNG